MRFSLSTNWNAARHADGEALVEEILSLGFDALELGYNTTEAHVEGIRRCVASGAVTADSVHSYCPVPISAPHGYPELYLLASLDDDDRAMATIMLGRTLEFAATMGARAVVLHAGRVFLDSRLFGSLSTRQLQDVLSEAGNDPASMRYQKVLEKALRRRAKRAPKHFDGFCRSLDTLLPRFEKAGVTLCLENLPSIEGFPDRDEMQRLRARFASAPLAYWHDMGHGQVREFFGWEGHLDTARLLLPMTRGIHIHDALPIDNDHLPPGRGRIDFSAFAFYGAADVIRVFEPEPQAKPEVLRDALRRVRQAWAGDAGLTS
ncbi:MAG: sugar phosphate isomerase/epimerase [Kiritimatiellaeota bacterium]|nr:sugar phosphate isomerase/epimerase [Kiritimatiellota bacterium]